ncbi:MAG: hypothetical protein Kow0042_02760 [Calditrichia bacterium]
MENGYRVPDHNYSIFLGDAQQRHGSSYVTFLELSYYQPEMGMGGNTIGSLFPEIVGGEKKVQGEFADFYR